ncbi:hypothetical protein [Streptomyces sp. NPDC058279]|uniref:hypothetical protein n=1 Tax=Streptomyces sp. NPDC058279 TaxID=3346418 RepID=UPI0036E2B013
MNPHDIPALISHLQATFATVEDMSVAVSGSLARRDFRTTTGGRIVSDLDLIPVVASRAEVPTARAALTPILRDIADKFLIQATAAITLKPVFEAVIHAPYRTSITGDWLCNGLRLPHPASETGPSPSTPPTPKALPWLIQPVAYYLSKANTDDPQTNIVKARSAATLLARHLDGRLPGTLDDLPHTLRNLFAEQRVEPLASSSAYLDAPTRPGLHRTVRDLVFLENQGLPFAESALATDPSIPNREATR